jgi:SAM-dependent methyltransferase
LERVNASAAVPVEVVAAASLQFREGGGEVVNESVSPLVAREFLEEGHRRRYGRPWALGKYIFEFVVASGLRPEHRLLDFGCGALRFGVHAIHYLNAGRYFGVDKHLPSLEAAVTYEIPIHGLELKHPRLLWSDDFAFWHFGTTFDWVLDFSASLKLDQDSLCQLLNEIVRVLAPEGRLLTAPFLPASVSEYERAGLKLARGPVVQHCPLLTGHDFLSTNSWWEFVTA